MRILSEYRWYRYLGSFKHMRPVGFVVFFLSARSTVAESSVDLSLSARFPLSYTPIWLMLLPQYKMVITSMDIVIHTVNFACSTRPVFGYDDGHRDATARDG